MEEKITQILVALGKAETDRGEQTKKLDKIEGHLKALNGRVVTNKEDIAVIKTWGRALAFIIPLIFMVISYLI